MPCPGWDTSRSDDRRSPPVTRVEASAPSRLLLLGGPPLGPRLIYWNFVASSQDKIDRAAQAWRDRAFPPIPTDDQEFIPLPETSR